MFVALSSYEVSIIIRALQTRRDALTQQRARATPQFAAKLEEEAQQLRTLELSLSNEQAKHELKEPDAPSPITPGQLEPVNLKDCEGFPVPPLMDSVEKSPPPTEPNLGAEYYLLKFIDAMREKFPDHHTLAHTSTSDVIEALGQTLSRPNSKTMAELALSQLFSMEMARIVNHLEEG